VNPDTDTKLNTTTSNTSVKLNNKVATVTNKVEDAQATTSSSGSFSIEASGNLTMTVSGTKITLSVPDGAKYDLAAAASSTSNAAAITLTNQSDSSDVDTVTIKGNDFVSIKQSSNQITVEGVNPYVSSIDVSTLNSSSTSHTNKKTTGFEIAVTDGAGSNYAELDPGITYGKTATTAKFTDGTATLNVYTQTETDTAISTAVDAAKKSFNAMEYKGTVASATALAALTSQQIGYTYKASAGFTLPADSSSTGAAVTVKSGDLLIAQGTESNGVITTATLKWDVVPSGDEQTITFSSSTDNTNGIASVSDGSDTAGYKVAAGDKMGVKYSASKGIVTATVSHSPITAPATTGSTADVTQSTAGSAEFSAITGITEDGYGHVTGVTVHKLKVVDTHNALSSVASTVAASSNTATVTTKVNATDQSVSGSMSVTSDNLTVTAPSTTSMKINLEWGSF
jgi:hypothetical protein